MATRLRVKVPLDAVDFAVEASTLLHWYFQTGETRTYVNEALMLVATGAQAPPRLDADVKKKFTYRLLHTTAACKGACEILEELFNNRAMITLTFNEAITSPATSDGQLTTSRPS